jgi:rubrerythrin
LNLKEENMSKTEKDLQEAFSGESQANRKYTAFAKKAESEGYKQIARLFRAAAEAETVHALNHLRELGAVKPQKKISMWQLQEKPTNFRYVSSNDRGCTVGRNNVEISFTYANAVERFMQLFIKGSKISGKRNVDYYFARSAEIPLRRTTTNAPYAAP